MTCIFCGAAMEPVFCVKTGRRMWFCVIDEYSAPREGAVDGGAASASTNNVDR